MDLFSTDKEMNALLNKMKQQVKVIDDTMEENEKQIEELTFDLEKLKEQLEIVNFQLKDNLIKKESTEEKNREIFEFYEKLVSNCKTLNNFITRQNMMLETKDQD